MPASIAPITIRFIRNSAKTDGSTDDIIKIVRTSDETVRIDYVEEIITTLMLPIAVVSEEWLPVLLDMVAYDEEPFVAVQFDLPFAPSMLVRVASLQRAGVRSCITNAVRFALKYHCERQQFLQENPTECLSLPPPPLPPVVRPVSPTLQSISIPTPLVPPNLVPKAPATPRAPQPFASPLGLPSNLHNTIHLQAPSPMRLLTRSPLEEERAVPVATVAATTDDDAA